MDKKRTSSIGNIYSKTPRPSGKRQNDGGVVYTPSNQRRAQAESGVKRRAQSSVTKSTKTRRPQKSQFAVFFVCVMLFCAVACIITFAMIFNTVLPKREASSSETAAPTTYSPTESISSDGVKTQTTTALIISNSVNEKKLELYDHEEQRSFSVFIDNDSELKDKYGSLMTLSEFLPGAIVDVTYTTAGKVKVLRTSVNSWKHDMVTGAIANEEASEIVVSGTLYKYDQNTVVTYNGEVFDPAGINPADTISAEGYKTYATKIVIQKSHGIFYVKANSKILNGIAEIDTSLIVDLDKEVREPLPEGTHRVVVKGQNIEPYSIDFTIVRGEVFELDLSSVTYIGGSLTVTCDTEGVKLTVNGVDRQAGVPFAAAFGDQLIRVTKDGYVAWEQTISFNEPEMEVSVTMEEIVTKGKFRIETEPVGAHVYVDNVYYGISPLEVEADFGMRSLSFRKEGYLDSDFTVNLTEEEPLLKITLTMTPID